MQSIMILIDTILNLYTWILIAMVVFSWLFAFNVINPRNQFVSMIGDFLHKATEPVLRPIRRLLPAMGGIDLSPIVVFLAIMLIRNLMREYGPVF
ncbi:MAG: YggT family protein [Notoacmeibacter sp.]|nr:YggT family protein [Notoacmeibacter sp.]